MITKSRTPVAQLSDNTSTVIELSNIKHGIGFLQSSSNNLRSSRLIVNTTSNPEEPTNKSTIMLLVRLPLCVNTKTNTTPRWYI